MYVLGPVQIRVHRNGVAVQHSSATRLRVLFAAAPFDRHILLAWRCARARARVGDAHETPRHGRSDMAARVCAWTCSGMSAITRLIESYMENPVERREARNAYVTGVKLRAEELFV